MPPSPEAEYRRRRDDRRAEVAHLDRRLDRLGAVRLAVGLAGAGALVAALADALPPVALVPVALALAALFAVGRVLQTRRARLRRAMQFYERGLARLSGKPVAGTPTGARFLQLEHLYAADFDLFGPGSLFARLALTQTEAGESALADFLLAPADRPTLLDRQDAVRELAGRLDLRESLALLTGDLPEGVSYRALAAWGETTDAPPPAGRVRFVQGLGLANVALLILAAGGEMPGWAPLMSLVLSAVVAGPLFGWVRTVEGDLHDAVPNVWLLEALLARLERESFTASRLRELAGAFAPAGGAPSERLKRLRTLAEWHASRHNPLFAPVAFLLLEPVRLAWGFSRWRSAHGPLIGRWLATLGELEALNSLAGYSFENPADPFPDIVPGAAPVFAAEALAHPLLPAASAVANDVALGGPDDARLLLVSGSNMSGKSTLLRAVGANAVLALAGGPVRAKSLRLSVLAMGATLRVEDSLRDGRSRFLAEVERVRAVLEAGRGGSPLVFFFDELFSGTNSSDRRAGAEGVLHELLSLNAAGFVTTHDLALTELAEPLGEAVRNVHFADALGGEGGAAYTMRPGVVPAGNGVALMRAVGLKV